MYDKHGNLLEVRSEQGKQRQSDNMFANQTGQDRKQSETLLEVNLVILIKSPKICMPLSLKFHF